ncbi:MAG: aminoacyl-tRNA hydrolase [Lachnospiraceae bacterium]|nr:aminoacyl-tRNA hydrolase [Lachnospiraceae bacterium]
MMIIAGLGNPGDEYEHTRHNTGFEVLDELVKKYDVYLDFVKHKAQCGKGIIEGEKVMLMKPQTYMNNSGEAIADAVNYYKAYPNDELIVIYDDIDLPVGKIRIRENGSAGGHNGMKDIIAKLGTDTFTRVRVGVGAKPEQWDLADWVLSRFPDEEKALMKETRKRAAEAVGEILSSGVESAMSKYNG